MRHDGSETKCVTLGPEFVTVDPRSICKKYISLHQILKSLIEYIFYFVKRTAYPKFSARKFRPRTRRQPQPPAYWSPAAQASSHLLRVVNHHVFANNGGAKDWWEMVWTDREAVATPCAAAACSADRNPYEAVGPQSWRGDFFQHGSLAVHAQNIRRCTATYGFQT
jgi:hypothetical protein